MKRTGVLLVVLLAWQAFAQAQYLTLSTDRKDILLGEHFVLRLKLTVPAGATISAWPSLPDSVNHLEVISRGKVDSIREGNKVLYTQELTMTGFDSGHWVIPAIGVMVNGKEIRSASADINVQYVKLNGSEYNDVKEIIEVPPPGPNWKMILLYGLGIFLLAALLFFWWRNRGRKPAVEKPISRGTAYDKAIKALDALQQQQLPEKGEMKKYYSTLYDIFRGYGTAITGKRMMQQTTEDLLIWSRESLDTETSSRLAEVLRISDAVKFAKYGSSTEESRQGMDIMRRTIDTMNRKKDQP